MHPQWSQLEEAISHDDLKRAMELVDQYPDLLWEHDLGTNTAVTTALTDHLEIAHALATRLLAALQAGDVPEAKMYGAIHDLGEAWHSEWGGGWEVAEPYVVGLLHAPDDSLRYIAMNVLAFHWNTPKYREAFEQAMIADPDPDNRRMAVDGLGFVLRGTRDPRATSTLLEKLRDEAEDGSVRHTAYEALLELWLGWERAWKLTHPRLLDDRTRHLDKQFDVLLRELDEVRASGDATREAVLHQKIDAVLSEKDNAWKQTVDWELIEQISRGEVPEP